MQQNQCKEQASYLKSQAVPCIYMITSLPDKWSWSDSYRIIFVHVNVASLPVPVCQSVCLCLSVSHSVYLLAHILQTGELIYSMYILCAWGMTEILR